MPVWFDFGRPAGTKSHASMGGQHALGGRAKSGGGCLHLPSLAFFPLPGQRAVPAILRLLPSAEDAWAHWLHSMLTVPGSRNRFAVNGMRDREARPTLVA